MTKELEKELLAALFQAKYLAEIHSSCLNV